MISLSRDRDHLLSFRLRSRSEVIPPTVIHPTVGIRATVLAETMVNNGDHAPSGFTLGVSLIKPHLLILGELSLWKELHSMYIQSQDYECWHIIERGDYVIDPALEVQNYTSRELDLVAKNHRAKQLILDGLTSDDMEKVRSISSAKEVWKEIQLMHQGYDNHMLDLIGEFHSFQAQTGESISSYMARFLVLFDKLKAVRIDMTKVIPKDHAYWYIIENRDDLLNHFGLKPVLSGDPAVQTLKAEDQV